MRLAFCLNYFFPHGGLQRDFVQIAERCRDRGHDVDVYTMEWHGDYLPGIKIHLLPSVGWTNHGRCLNFTKKLLAILARKQYDCVIGFNKQPGLDIYYAADPCFIAKHSETSWGKKIMPRYQYYAKLERSVFEPTQKTKILYIAKGQKKLFQQYYGTQEERFYPLPPPINPNRKPTHDDKAAGEEIRAQYADQRRYLLLAVASAFKTKGIDRIIQAMKALPESLRKDVQLLVVGRDNPNIFKRQLRQANLETHIDFLGAVDEVVPLYLAADLLVHPARVENTGTVLLEAMLAGLPVLTTANCGYAEYVQSGEAGVVIDTPFQQANLDSTMASMLEDNEQLRRWGEQGKQYADKADFFSMPQVAMKVIEDVAKKN